MAKRPSDFYQPGFGNRIMSTLLFCVILAGFSLHESHACDAPLTYRIGSIDGRFGLSIRDVSDVASQAAYIWGRELGCDIFKEDPNGAIEILFAYDYRQAAIDNLRKTGLSIGNSIDSYAALKTRLDNLTAEYSRRHAEYVRDVNEYNKRLSAYNAQKDATYRKSSVSVTEYQQVAAKKQVLDTQLDNLRARLEELKRMTDTMNSMALVMNGIASNYNLAAVNYRSAKGEMAGEHQQARYEWRNYRKSITVYFYHDRNELIRVMAHEMGHAMGLKHSGNPEAIMYYLNQSSSLDLTSEDTAALKARFNR